MRRPSLRIADSGAFLVGFAGRTRASFCRTLDPAFGGISPPDPPGRVYPRVMVVPDLGPWDPLSLTDTIETFGEAGFRWWISGGRALALHVGDVQVAVSGCLRPWVGQELRPDLHENNLWCRRSRTGPWCLDVTLAEGDSEAWVYRRDPRIRVPWPQAVLRTADGVPDLAPELQLLFKSKDVRPKDDIDACQVIPELSGEARDRLAHLLPENHPWQQLLRVQP